MMLPQEQSLLPETTTIITLDSCRGQHDPTVQMVVDASNLSLQVMSPAIVDQITPVSPALNKGKKRGRPSKAVATKRSHISTVRVVDVAINDGGGTAADGGESVVTDNVGIGRAENGVSVSSSSRVKDTLRLFNTHYLHFVQVEEKRAKEAEANRSQCSPQKQKANGKKKGIKKDSKLALKVGDQTKDIKRPSKRPDLKAISKMIGDGTVLYPGCRIGHLPGIDVGQQFFSRAEMVVLGVHNHWLNGISFITAGAGTAKYSGYSFPLAVCVVLSGMYEDDVDNSEDVIYTGQGGHDLLSTRRQIKDQKMERGNLALQNCIESNTPVRVVRGHESTNSYCGKVYTYDGLYNVIESWTEKGVSGFTVYKFRLRRMKDQPVLTTGQVHFTRGQPKKLISELRGLVCSDISSGKENLPIPATNEVDIPPFAPKDFEYSMIVEVTKNIKTPPSAAGCKCLGDCTNPEACSCAKLNGSNFPYVRKNGGRLVEAKAVIYECGPCCGCGPSCLNRTSQKGLKYRLEVFRTSKKGWAVRSWDSIPSGAPICEYTGILTQSDEIDSALDNNYIFDIDCIQTMKGLDGREKRLRDVDLPHDVDDNKLEGPEFCIDAGRVGGVARFINHSCQPNLFVQCVLSSHHDIKLARIMLFAADNIPPLQELTYDYGYALDSVVGPDGKIKTLDCLCGAPDCRKRMH